MGNRMLGGFFLTVWRGATLVLQPVIFLLYLRKKPHFEKNSALLNRFGFYSDQRTHDRVITLHAKGLGETLSVLGIVAFLTQKRQDVQIVIVTNAAQAIPIIHKQGLNRTTAVLAHIDSERCAGRFLKHWQPDLLVWTEQEIWPVTCVKSLRRSATSVALISGRINDASFQKRRKLIWLFQHLFAKFDLISAQEKRSAGNLEKLGARDVRVDGSLKPIAPPLAADAEALAKARAQIGGRRVWVLASSHPEDEALAFAAHRAVVAHDPQALLIVAPRLPERRAAIATALDKAGLTHIMRSLGDTTGPDQTQGPDAQVWLADTFGELGLWYRLAQVAYVGGSNSAVQGHNPWEPVILSCPVLHGPHTANFAADYAELGAAGAAACVTTPEALADLIKQGTFGPMVQAAQSITRDRMDRLDDLCHRLLDLIPDVTSGQTS